ncbi:MAG TPA: hypothetical protein VM715_00655 [Candidatus Acidoferrum sp.]|nr:hypothetical protein [Candidatus Acidoferrum sp.]
MKIDLDLFHRQVANERRRTKPVAWNNYWQKLMAEERRREPHIHDLIFHPTGFHPSSLATDEYRERRRKARKQRRLAQRHNRKH